MEPRPETNTKNHKCEQCELSFALDTSLYAHKTIEHKEDPPHSCLICNTAFFSPTSYGLHLFRHSLETKTADSKAFRCCVCSLDYPSEHGLRVHISQHTGVRLSRFKNPGSTLKKNQFRTCDYCPAMIRGASRYREHLETHKTKPFACQQCDLVFRSKFHLDLHERRHQELKDLPPDAVGKYFSQVCAGIVKVTKTEED